MLEPTTERIAAAKRAQSRTWTFGPEGAVEVDTDGVLRMMVGAGLIKPHYVSPTAQINGQDDYYQLTEFGEQWLAEADNA